MPQSAAVRLFKAHLLTQYTEHKMSEFKMEHNVQTGEILEIPLTDKELKELEKLRAEAALLNEQENAAEAQKASDRAALLTQLGITEEQAKLLLG
jgi:hypothetical protein